VATILLQDHKPVGDLQSMGRSVVGPRKPWECSFPSTTPEFEDSLLAPLRLTRERQLSGLDGRRAHARWLLRSELAGLRIGSARPAPIIDVAALLAQTLLPSGNFRVAGVARPSPGGRLGVGDPASGAAVEAVGVGMSVKRGAAVAVAGSWDPQHKQLVDAALIGRTLGSAAADSQIAEHSQAAQATDQLPCDSPRGWLQELAHKKRQIGIRPDESARFPEVLDILEDANRRHQLSLGTLCCVHELLTHTSSGIGGKLRDGAAIVRLNGVPTFFAPPAASARHGTEVFVKVLAEYISSQSDEVPAPVLAADGIARFTDLHPFVDGNGRVARAIATWLLVRAGYRANPNLTLGDFLHYYRREHYLALRHHELDPWTWHQFFFDAVLTCFLPACSAVRSTGMRDIPVRL
jgi:fido (protein-threonine AMPylation protein)